MIHLKLKADKETVFLAATAINAQLAKPQYGLTQDRKEKLLALAQSIIDQMAQQTDMKKFLIVKKTD